MLKPLRRPSSDGSDKPPTDIFKQAESNRSDSNSVDDPGDLWNEAGEEYEERTPSMEPEALTLFEQAIEETKTLPTYTRKAALKSQITVLQNEAAKLRPPPLPEPDPSGNSYPVFIPRTGIDPIERLETQWGAWLMSFNEMRPEGEKLDRNYLFRKQLLELDPKLINALTSYLQRVGKESPYFGMRAQDLVPSDEALPASSACVCKFI